MSNLISWKRGMELYVQKEVLKYRVPDCKPEIVNLLARNFKGVWAYRWDNGALEVLVEDEPDIMFFKRLFVKDRLYRRDVPQAKKNARTAASMIAKRI
jgi:hypothetical protein